MYSCNSRPNLAKEFLDGVLKVQPKHLARLRPPARDGQSISIIVSDSAMAMITGSKNKPKKHSMEEVFKNRGPGSSNLEVIHRMSWGADLRKIVVEVMAILADVRQRHPDIQVNVIAFWNGNELVGKKGITDDISWPWNRSEGDPAEWMATVRRHIATLVESCRKRNVSSLGFMSNTNGAMYTLGPQYTEFMLLVKGHVEETYGQGFWQQNAIGLSVKYVESSEWAERVELRDQYHMELSDKNQHETLVYFMSLLYVLHISGSKEWTQEWKKELHRLGRHNYRNPEVFEENPNRQADLRNDAYDEIKSRIFASRTPLNQQAPGQGFTRYEVQQEQPDYGAPQVSSRPEPDQSRSHEQATAQEEAISSSHGPAIIAEQMEPAEAAPAEEQAENATAGDEDSEDEPDAEGDYERDMNVEQPEYEQLSHAPDDVELIEDEPMPEEAAEALPTEWTDTSRCPGMFEADSEAEVVHPSKSHEVVRRDNWKPLAVVGHVPEYRYVMTADEPGQPKVAGIRIGNSVFDLIEFTGLMTTS